MNNNIIEKRGKKHVLFSAIGFLLFAYIAYSFHLLFSKSKFDSTVVILIATGILMLVFSLVHAFLGYLMIFRYKPMMDNIKNMRVLKVLSYEDEPKKLFVVRCAGRTVIADQI